MRRGPIVLMMVLLAGSASLPGSGRAAEVKHRVHGQAAHIAKTAPVAASAPAPPTENLVVHGQRRYSTAPMPNQEIHDPADALRDPATGAAIGKFGHAYLDANPVPSINPELNGDQSPISVGIQR